MPTYSVTSGQNGQQNHEPQLQGNFDSPQLAQNAFILLSSYVLSQIPLCSSPSEHLLTQLFKGSLHKDLFDY